MAKKEKGGAERVDIQENAKMGDIRTAAKSTMEAEDYKEGYPAQDGVLRQGFWQGVRVGKAGGGKE